MADIGRAVRGGLWLYLASLVGNVSGYLYWLIVSRLGGPGLLGVTSAVVGLAAIISTAVSLGAPRAAQRHIAFVLGRRDLVSAAEYYWALLVYTIAAYTTATLVLIALAATGFSIAGYVPQMLQAAALIVALQGFAQAAQAYAIAVIRTELVLYTAIIGNAAKLALGPALVAAGYGWAGATIGYVAPTITQTVAITPMAVKWAGRPRMSLAALKETLRAGIAAWLPTLLAILGQWLGVVAVYGFTGATQTGFYYAANAIVMFIASIPIVLLGALLPVLSSMKDGRKRLAWQTTRLATALVAPLATMTAAYPQQFLGLLGKGYEQAAPVLVILALSTIPLPAINTLNNLAYAYGLYRETLALGLAQTLPRAALYVALTPAHGALGAALATASGTMAGLVYSISLARKIGYRANRGTLAKTLMPPLLALAATEALNPPWLLGVALHLGSYIAYARLGVINRDDIRQLAKATLPPSMYRRAERLAPVLDKLFGELD